MARAIPCLAQSYRSSPAWWAAWGELAQEASVEKTVCQKARCDGGRPAKNSATFTAQTPISSSCAGIRCTARVAGARPLAYSTLGVLKQDVGIEKVPHHAPVLVWSSVSRAWSACRRARTHAAAEAGFSQPGTATSRKAPAAARTVPSLAPDIATECHEEHPVDMP